MRTMVRIGLLILAAALAAVVLSLITRPEEPAVGTPAPLTKGIDADGVASSLADYRGKVVMLDFWANW